MAANKTTQNDNPVENFTNAVDDERKRRDSYECS